MHRELKRLVMSAALLAAAGVATACSDDGGTERNVTDGSANGGDAGATNGSEAGASGVSGGANTGASGSTAGGATAGGATGSPNCDSKLRIVVRDFTPTHKDFESFDGNGPFKNLVKEDLGSDKKPVYAPSGSTSVSTGKLEFDQWYRDTAGVNMQIPVEIEFMESTPGVFVYDNSNFFPIDNMGLGNGPKPSHNFLFTTEAHTLFTYKGAETFTFRGDDDLWVFINGKLAVDLGGVHPVEMGSVSLDAEAARLGIEKGKTYPMDIFHAERHTDESNYRIETTIDLSCIENVPII